MKTVLLQSVAILLLAACGVEMNDAPSSDSASDQGLSKPVASRRAELIPGEYVVVFKSSGPDAAALAKSLASAHGGTVTQTFSDALSGFSGKLNAAAVAAIAADARVAFVEQEQRFFVSTAQANPPWGLDRIDQRALPLNKAFNYTKTGAGVTAYVIDTGIRFDHSEFGGRAVSGYDAIDGGSADDCHGHGTHVAGTLGGKTYGVAKGVKLVGVRVLGCDGSGTTSQIIAGIDWVTRHHAAGAPAVANLSLGGMLSLAVDNAVSNSIADGVTYVVAAGNGVEGYGVDACVTSPARVPAALTVSAVDSADQRAAWANFGSCVDLFAPGVNITSSVASGVNTTAVYSGTSMATPHVAGIAALYLQGAPSATPAQVATALVNATTKNVVGNLSSGPNRLAFTAY